MNRILKELRNHVPFTSLGAFSAVVLMIIFRNMPHDLEHGLFYVFHPLHVVLSAMVTTAMYKIHQSEVSAGRVNIIYLVLIGYFGSIGIATLSDSVIPFIGEKLLAMPHAHVHAGFIEKWYMVNSAAILGIALGYFSPRTYFPHAGHVLISTWASLFHVMMAMGDTATVSMYIIVFIFLFLSVWLPCCVSDIVFPLIFVRRDSECVN